MKNRIFFSILVLMVLFLLSSCNQTSNNKTDDLTRAPSHETDSNQENEEDLLKSILPKPDFGSFETHFYSFLNQLDADMNEVSEDQYKEYISLCKEKGFTVEKEENEYDYCAFNEKGYELSVYYYKSLMQLNVTLSTPTELSRISWPKSNIANTIPKPESDIGKIEYDSSDGFYIYVGNTSLDAFNDYVEQCLDNGYNIEYEYDRSNHWFIGHNKDGNELIIEYQGFSIISIELNQEIKVTDNNTGNEQASTAEMTETAANEETKSISSVDSKGIRQEIKEAIDSYEAFVDEYCTFMESYNESDLTQTLKYLELVSKEVEMSQQFEKIEEEELSDDELSYYAQVSLRCSQKLLQVSE